MESKFLPDSVSGALKSFAKRATGALLVVFGIVAIFSLLRHNPYLDGFAAASTFGNQSVLGQIVGFLRYLVGFVPALFIFMVLARIGLVWLFKWDEESGAFYNLLRTFITICAGSAAFGLIAPMATYGGMFGAIVATDVGWLIGGWGILLGLLVMAGFFVMAATVLHIKWSHVQATASRIWRVLRWLASVFHLARPIANDVADTDNSDEEAAEDDDEDLSDADASDGDEKQTKKSRASRKVVQTKSVAIPARAASRNTDAQYQLPDPKFLERSSFGKNVVTPELKQNAKAMEIHFAEYGVNGRVVGIRPGPIVTLYEFEPDAGTRIAKVNDTVKDMTRAMATQNIRIAHIPNTHLIGVEMVNLNRQTVKYRSLIEDSAFVNSKYKIPLALGVNIGGNPMYFDLAKMPHMLIAGRTGSGKSVFVQSIITSIVYHFTPDKCKLMIIDPKGVDFGFWDDIPHLITPIVKLDPVAAVNALKWAVREMDERYKRMAVVNARDFVTYNEIMAQKRASGEVLTQQVVVGTDDETGELLFETQNI
ncbi:MAG: DNA translocase FtsK, partial [Candidatus Enterousia sp.]